MFSLKAHYASEKLPFSKAFLILVWFYVIGISLLTGQSLELFYLLHFGNTYSFCELSSLYGRKLKYYFAYILLHLLQSILDLLLFYSGNKHITFS
jgi:hypothetical protein